MYDYDTYDRWPMRGTRTKGEVTEPCTAVIDTYDWGEDGLYVLVNDQYAYPLVKPTHTDQPIGGPDQEWVGEDMGWTYRLRFVPEPPED